MGTMTALARPDVGLHPSWAAAVLDFGSEQIHGSGSWEVAEQWRGDTTEASCRVHVETLRDRGDPSLEQPVNRVLCDYFWVVEGAGDSGDSGDPGDLGDPGDPGGAGEVVGFLAVRHTLNAFLLQSGGHIGYSVRPSRRREGHASRALGLGLDHLRGLGVPRALLTVHDDNAGSRRVVEAAGGVYESSFDALRRYWIDL
ncbi:GNAT family N-acetyltransferase [soil metagenome]